MGAAVAVKGLGVAGDVAAGGAAGGVGGTAHHMASQVQKACC